MCPGARGLGGGREGSQERLPVVALPPTPRPRDSLQQAGKTGSSGGALVCHLEAQGKEGTVEDLGRMITAARTPPLP